MRGSRSRDAVAHQAKMHTNAHGGGSMGFENHVLENLRWEGTPWELRLGEGWTQESSGDT